MKAPSTALTLGVLVSPNRCANLECFPGDH
jgi:hypothetical protein